MSIGNILTAISAANKIVPVVEAIAAEVGPLVQTEISDGKQILADVHKALGDLKTAFGRLQAAAQSANK